MKKQIVLMFAFTMLILFSFNVSATYSKDTVVAGTIYNYAANAVVTNADVTVSCNGIDKNTVSDLSGDYSVQYAMSDCTTGDLVTVSAVKGDLSGVKSDVVKDFGLTVNIAVVNVPMTPEFGFYMGSLTLLSAVGVFFLIRRD